MRRKPSSLTSQGTGVFAVIFSVAKVIFGEHADSTCSGFCPDSSQVFFELLQHLPWEDHIHVFKASRTWPKRLQDDFGRAMKKTQRRAFVPRSVGQRRDLSTAEAELKVSGGLTRRKSELPFVVVAR
jgi:hypothetical protein